jgi:hypothetical protein
MTTRRQALFWAASLLVLCRSPIQAAEQSPRDFVAAIYKSYQGKGAKGIMIDSPRAKGLLTPGLNALIEADAKRAARRREVPRLDGDPFIDAQDFEDIGPVAIDVTEKGPTAVAKVSFTNFGEKKLITLNLVKTGAEWRIDDFAGPTSIRKMLGRK